jgi:ABC-type bacteriocin/lantibiotic exporter with double-glycine peptidase domain
VAVIGKVGSGKSSLLLAILGEVPVVFGELRIKEEAKIAYAEQEPLIITGTIQDNITFGSELDPDWYIKVVQACCLDEDFRAMPSGDQTKLGEMGHNLSGGQKSRISLARAIYQQDSSIILIDATLSSLDAKVSAHVFANAIRGLCKDKLVFLVTYDLD